MTNFIEEGVAYITDNIPTSRLWAEDCVLTTLSLAAGPKRRVVTRVGPLALNLMGITIGPSGVAAKTLPLINYVRPVVKGLSEHIGIDLVAPNRFSVEGMVEWLSNTESWGCFVRDEFTSILKDTKKGYLSDILEFFSETYDGTVHKRATKSCKIEKTSNVYLPFLTTTTPYLYRIMKPGFWVQGTGNRMRVTMFDFKDTKPFDTPDDWRADTEIIQKQQDEIEKIVEQLKIVYQNAPMVFIMDDDSLDVWVKYREKLNDEIKKRYRKDPYDLNYTYMARMAEISLKLASLHCIGRIIDRIKNEKAPRLLPLETEDIEYGMKKEDEALKSFQEMLFSWRRYNPQKDTHSSHDNCWKLCSFLAEAPNRLFNTKQWMDAQDITTNDKTFRSLRDHAVHLGWVKELNPNELDLSEVEYKRLVSTGTNVKVWTVSDLFLKS